MPSASELIAHNRTDEEVGDLIGADWLIYQDLEDLVDSAKEGNSEITQFECSVFDGHYITGDVDQKYLKRLDSQRNNSVKEGSSPELNKEDSQVIGIHNNSSS